MRRLNLLFVLLALLLTSCQASGPIHNVGPQDLKKVTVGSSPEDVRRILGQPHRIEYFSRLNEESWTYYRPASIEDNFVVGFKGRQNVTSVNVVPYVRSFGFGFDVD